MARRRCGFHDVFALPRAPHCSAGGLRRSSATSWGCIVPMRWTFETRCARFYGVMCEIPTQVGGKCPFDSLRSRFHSADTACRGSIGREDQAATRLPAVTQHFILWGYQRTVQGGLPAYDRYGLAHGGRPAMSSSVGPGVFFVAGAIDGRLRLHGLPSSGPWDPSRVMHRTTQELQVLLSRQARGWVILTVDELNHALDCSWGVPTPITLYISTALLPHAQQKWEGNAPSPQTSDS